MKNVFIFLCLFMVCSGLLYAKGGSEIYSKIIKKIPKTSSIKLSTQVLKEGAEKAGAASRRIASHSVNFSRLASRGAGEVLTTTTRTTTRVVANASRTQRIGGRISRTLSTKTYNIARVLRNTDDLVQNGIKTGGYFGELKGVVKNLGQPGSLAIHHMPARSAVRGANLWNGQDRGPAIIMDAIDHAKTASYKYSASAKEFQTVQKELLKQGKFADAWQMDIDDLIVKGLYQKYKHGIDQAMEVIRDLRMTGVL